MSLPGGNCVGGSVACFAAMPGAPRFVVERQGGAGRRRWPEVTSSGGLFVAALDGAPERRRAVRPQARGRG